ncbi:hypothetical protein ACIBBD_02050 [Streptomyces sp. NPDC051315]|uniref:hypothetical protein n=1 Tax=Streptomyces sp. NPDC051315 TaxID=3365650 RepID=UPI0037A040B5
MPSLRALAVTAVASILLLFSAPSAEAAETPVYSGRGWKIWTSQGIYSLNPDPYEIVFADTTARSKIKPYLAKPAAQVTSITGVQIKVTDTIDVTPADACPPRHRIVVHYSYQPIGVKGMSQARACYEIANGSAWGGHMLMDSEYWSSCCWFSTDPVRNDAYRANAVSHELGHVLGLDHPNYDKDGDGTVESYECVTTATGTRPLLCSPNGGYYNATDAGKFTPPFDEPGLKQLIANWYLRQNAS